MKRYISTSSTNAGTRKSDHNKGDAYAFKRTAESPLVTMDRALGKVWAVLIMSIYQKELCKF